MAHKARKRFGQHFLIDSTICWQIVNAMQLQTDDKVIEIGPGKGALTNILLKQLSHLHLVELDRDLIAFWQQHSEKDRLSIHEADVLEFDFSQCFAKDCHYRIIGNLPYNISTPLLFRLIDFAWQIDDMVFMLQKEVVDRMTADVGSKDYGRLSVMLQYHFIMKPICHVPPSCFAPPPKVDSTVVYLKPRPKPISAVLDYELFATIVRCSFAHRRKTLANNLKSLTNVNDLRDQGIDVSLRPEQLTVNDYINISNIMYNIRPKMS